MPRIPVEHVLQPAILCRDIDATMDLLHALLGAYPSERVDIRNTGVNNAVYAFADQTFLELIEPYDPDASAMRLLDRLGEGWHMIAVDLAPVPVDDVARDLAAAGVRVVRSILGVSLATDDPEGMVERYTRLGFRFGEAWDDAGGGAFWTDPAPALGVPIEFRRVASEGDG